MGIEFLGANWAPGIILGFLYSPADHKVPLTDPINSIDLFLRIEANPKLNPNPEPVLRVIAQKLLMLREMAVQALIKGDPNSGNPHTLLIIQKSLTKVLNGITETQAQLDRIHQTWEKWLYRAPTCTYYEKLFGETTAPRMNGYALKMVASESEIRTLFEVHRDGQSTLDYGRLSDVMWNILA